MSAAVTAPYAPPAPTFEQRAREACEALARRPWVAFAVLALISFAAYANAVPNQFVFDDDSTLRLNALVREPSRLLELFTGPSYARSYRPIRYLSFALDYAIGGDSPRIYHLFNALYHSIVSWLVLRVIHRVTGDARAAAAGALLFALHPAHVESVAYISGRRDLLTTLFYLTGLLAFFRWREAPGLAPGWVAAILASLGLALGSKEMAVTFPAMIVLYELTFDRRALVRHVPIYALGALAAAYVIWRTVSANISGQTHPWGGSWEIQAMTAVCIVANYVRLCVFPGTLLADYSIDAFPLARSLGEPRTLVAAALLLGAAATGVALFRRRPLVSFGIAWFFLTITPVAQIVPYHELGADHQVYLPSIGVVLLAGLGFAWIWDRAGGQAAAAVLGVVLAAFAARTEVRIPEWRSAETIYASVLRTAPRCARAHVNMGAIIASKKAASAAERDRNRRTALAYYDQAIGIDPDYLFARVGRAKFLELLGQREASVAEYERALEVSKRLDPTPVPPETILMHLGRWEEAKAILARKLAENKRARDAMLLGRTQEMLGEHHAAYASYALAATSRTFADKANFAAIREAQRAGDMRAAQEHLKLLEKSLGTEKTQALFRQQSQEAKRRAASEAKISPSPATATGAPRIVDLGGHRPGVRIGPAAPTAPTGAAVPLPGRVSSGGEDEDDGGLLDEGAPPPMDRGR